MLKQAHRFHGRASLRTVYQKGRTLRANGLSLRYIINTRRHSYRAAVVVSKTISKSAVVRNRLRRRIFEIIRECSDNIKLPLDMVITIHNPQVIERSAADLREEVTGLLTKADIIK